MLLFGTALLSKLKPSFTRSDNNEDGKLELVEEYQEPSNNLAKTWEIVLVVVFCGYHPRSHNTPPLIAPSFRSSSRYWNPRDCGLCEDATQTEKAGEEDVGFRPEHLRPHQQLISQECHDHNN